MAKRRDLIVIIAILIILPLIMFFILSLKNQNFGENQVCSPKKCFNVEIASTYEELTTGLMFRESLDENSGMLFVFSEEGSYKFWMKNMLIPLDVIWINSDKEVIYIEKNVQPCFENICNSFGPDENSLYVLEINSGMADKSGIEVGDKVEINLK